MKRVMLIDNVLVRLECEVTAKQIEKVRGWIHTGEHGGYDACHLDDTEVNLRGYNTFATAWDGIITVQVMRGDPRPSAEVFLAEMANSISDGRALGKLILFALKGTEMDITDPAEFNPETDRILDLTSDNASSFDYSWVDDGKRGALFVFASKADSQELVKAYEEIKSHLRQHKRGSLPVRVEFHEMSFDVLADQNELYGYSPKKFKSVVPS